MIFTRAHACRAASETKACEFKMKRRIAAKMIPLTSALWFGQSRVNSIAQADRLRL
jgi:hypothetical protein